MLEEDTGVHDVDVDALEMRLKWRRLLWRKLVGEVEGLGDDAGWKMWSWKSR